MNMNSEECISVEDLEMTQQMNALGLPLSFQTSKTRDTATPRTKTNGTKLKLASHEKDRKIPLSEDIAFSKTEHFVLSTSFHDSNSEPSCLCVMEGQVDTPCHDAKADKRGDLHIDEPTGVSALSSIIESGEEVVMDDACDTTTGDLANFEFLSDTVSFEMNTEVLGTSSFHIDPEERLEDTCSHARLHQDGDLLNKHDYHNNNFLNEHDLEKCTDDSYTSYNKYLKDGLETLQMCSVEVDSPVHPHPFDDHHDNFICCERGDWKVIWDPSYSNYYFFNVQSLESTWYPPLGLEEYAFSCSNNLSRKETHVTESEKNAGYEHFHDSISIIKDSLTENDNGLHCTEEQTFEMSDKMDADIVFSPHSTATGNGNSNVQLSLCPPCATDCMKDEKNDYNDLDEQKKNQQGGTLDSYYGYDRSSSNDLDTHAKVAINMKRRVRESHSQKVQELAWCVSDSVIKYWCQRYTLFSRFDKGIKMDEESWFSVTPEPIAKHHAIRCGGGIIIDCFSGVGGNAIQFAMRGKHVIAIDIDSLKIDYAHHNAIVYGVSEKIDFIKGDFFKIAHCLKGDAVFLSPPWGGPNYAKRKTYDLRSLKPHDGYYLFKLASMIAAKVVMFLPRNVNLNQLAELSFSVDSSWNLEYMNHSFETLELRSPVATCLIPSSRLMGRRIAISTAPSKSNCSTEFSNHQQGLLAAMDGRESSLLG